MTWGDWKKTVEDQGVTDQSEVGYVDVYSGDKPQVEVAPNGVVDIDSASDGEIFDDFDDDDLDDLEDEDPNEVEPSRYDAYDEKLEADFEGGF